MIEEVRKLIPLDPRSRLRPMENNFAIKGPPTSFPIVSITARVVNMRAVNASGTLAVARPCSAGSSPSDKPQTNRPRFGVSREVGKGVFRISIEAFYRKLAARSLWLAITFQIQ